MGGAHDLDALFVSHVHPDHCDERTLRAFRRDIPILVLDHGPNFLHRVLSGMGFTNLIPVRDGETAMCGPIRATLYAPFTGHVFHESLLGNLIDCAALFEHGGVSVFNFNDNTPDLASAERLFDRHGPVTVAQLAYNAAVYVAEFPGAQYNPLFIHGNCGLGKTHLLQGLCKKFIQHHPSKKWMYLTGEEFTNEFLLACVTTASTPSAERCGNWTCW